MHRPDIVNDLDIKAESSPLCMADRAAKREADEFLAKLMREEELKWSRRAKVKYVREGDNNTKFFHLIANGKRRKKKNHQLEQDVGTIVSQDMLKAYITNYYKRLFGHPDSNFVMMDEDMSEDIPQLSREENTILTAPFSEKEIFDAISQMERNKASGLNGFPAELYQKCWETIKGDLLPMFDNLFNEDLSLFCLNFGIITLLPKKDNAQIA